MEQTYRWLSGKPWHPQHNCVGDTIAHHQGSDKMLNKRTWLTQFLLILEVTNTAYENLSLDIDEKSVMVFYTMVWRRIGHKPLSKNHDRFQRTDYLCHYERIVDEVTWFKFRTRM